MISKVVIKPEMTHKIEAVIGDWSGTFVDKYCIAPTLIMKRSFARSGIPVDTKIIRKYMGLPKFNHIQQILYEKDIFKAFTAIHKRSPTRVDALTIYNDFNQILSKELDSSLFDPTPHTGSVISHLRSLGIKIGVTTGFDEKTSQKIADNMQVKGIQIDAHVGSDSVLNGSRPKPFMIWRCMDKLDVYKKSTVVKLGDSDLDVKEGINGGCWTVGVYGYSTHMNVDNVSKNEIDYQKQKDQAKLILQQAGAEYVIEHIGYLPDVINHINNRMSYPI